MDIKREHIYKAMIFIALAFIMWIKIPHTNMSLSQIILPEIHLDKIRRANLSGLLILIPLVIAYRQILKSNTINSKLIVAIAMIILIPHGFDMLAEIKVPYYKLQSGLKSIEVLDDGYCFDYAYQKICDVHLFLEVENHKDKVQEFGVAIILPQELVDKNMPREIVIPDKFSLEKGSTLKIAKRYEIEELRDFTEKEIESVYYGFIDYNIKLFNDEESVIIRLDK